MFVGGKKNIINISEPISAALSRACAQDSQCVTDSFYTTGCSSLRVNKSSYPHSWQGNGTLQSSTVKACSSPSQTRVVSESKAFSKTCKHALKGTQPSGGLRSSTRVSLKKHKSHTPFTLRKSTGRWRTGFIITQLHWQKPQVSSVVTS